MRKRFAVVMLVLLMLTFTSTIQASAQSQATQSRVVVVTLNGPLTPVWTGYLERGTLRV